MPEQKGVISPINFYEFLIRAANEAMLEQKKRKRTGDSTQSPCVAIPGTSGSVAAVATISKTPKDVKRLQATKQAVKHAMQLLARGASYKMRPGRQRRKN